MKNATLMQDYYKAVGEKDFATIEGYLHPDVEFIGPLARFSGKEAVFEAVKRFTTLFTTLTVRHCFDSSDQAVVVYDLVTSKANFSAAVLATCKEGLIAKLELFFDTRHL